MVQKSVTVQNVAQHARVSTATVSRTLSSPEKVSSATRDAVMEAIRATGYRVNQAARNLRKQQAGAVLVLVPNLENPFFSKILSGISAGFAQSDLSVLIADTATERHVGQSVRDYFLNGRIDGMICLDGSLLQEDLALFRSDGFADRIVFACEWVHEAAYPSVRSDNFTGAQMAVDHLYELGHRKIAHITGPAGNVLTRIRREGALEARKRLGLPIRDDWIIRGDFSLSSGQDAAQKIISMTDRPTAVFCASDMVAIGLISGLEAAGLSVPHDISVIGFDDIEMAEYTVPSLTTIRQDRRGLGTRAAHLLLNRLTSASNLEAQRIDLLDVTLTIRKSTTSPR